MTMTRFPHGISSFGAPIVGPGAGIFGDVWFVDSENGSDGNGGTDKDEAFATIGKAVTSASARDTIFVKGTTGSVGQVDDYDEEVSIPYTKPGIRIIGCGNSNSEGVLWGPSATAKTLLKVRARDVYVSGFRMRPNGATAGAIALVKNGDTASSDGVSDSSGFTLENCVLRSQTTTGYGVCGGNSAAATLADSAGANGYVEMPNDITFRNVTFDSLLSGILVSTPATVGNRMHVIDCTFTGKASNGIQVSCKESLIKNSTFMDMAGGMMCDTDTNNGGTYTPENMVTGCVFGSEASAIAEVHCGTTDSWAGSIFGDFNDSATYIDTTTGGFIIAPDNA